MHRLMIAIGLSTLLWATSALTAPVAVDAVTSVAGAEACAVDRNSPGPDDAQQWRDARSAIAVVTDSVWKSAPVHAGLSAARDARIFELARSASAPDPPAAAAPTYLRHTPLLI